MNRIVVYTSGKWEVNVSNDLDKVQLALTLSPYHSYTKVVYLVLNHVILYRALAWIALGLPFIVMALTWSPLPGIPSLVLLPVPVFVLNELWTTHQSIMGAIAAAIRECDKRAKRDTELGAMREAIREWASDMEGV